MPKKGRPHGQLDGHMNLKRLRFVNVSAVPIMVMGLWMILPFSQAFAEAGFLGLEVQGINAKLAKVLDKGKSAGVLVKDVAIGEAGALAGFRRGDLIVKFARSRVRSFDDLLKAVVKTKPSQEITVDVYRDGKHKSLKLKLGNQKGSHHRTTGHIQRGYRLGRSARGGLPGPGLRPRSAVRRRLRRFAGR